VGVSLSQPNTPRQLPTPSDNQDDHGDPLHPRFRTIYNLYHNIEEMHPIYELSPEQVEERQSHAMPISDYH